MKKNRVMMPLLAAVWILAIAACSPLLTVPPADLVIVNGAAITADPENPNASCIAVRGEKVWEVGSESSAGRFIKEGVTRVIDAGGCTVVPGFNDAHLHFLSGGRSLMNLDFRYIRDVREILRMVEERVKQCSPGELITGRSWDHELFPDKKWPTREMLDAVAPENPVMLSRTDGHSVWVNSVVIRNSGITRETPDPPGGTIVRDPVTGEPTGIFKEAAQDLLKTNTGAGFSPQAAFETRCRELEKALEEARKKGVTSVQHLTGDVEVLQKFRDEGRLTARVTFSMDLTGDEARLSGYDLLREKYGRENDWIRFGTLKGFIDGSLGSGTALLFEPYTDDPSTSGLPQMSYEELESLVIAADRRGFQIGIHAIGSKANRWILDAYGKAQEANGKRDSRHRSEHAQILAQADIPRFAELGVIASMQPTHCITDKSFAEKRLGYERCRGAYAWKSLLDAGASIAFGTDWPVEPLDPLEGLYAAVTRKARGGEPGEGWFPEQRLTLEKAVELYTLGSAYAEFMEKRKGMLRKDYLADIVIFDADLSKLPPEDWLKTKVAYTIVGGKIVYHKGP